VLLAWKEKLSEASPALLRLQDSHKLLLGIGGIAAFALGIVWFVILPQREQVQQLKTQYRLERSQVLGLENFALAHPQGEKYLQELRGKKLVTEKKLPNTLDMGQFMRELEIAAAQSGVQILQIKPGVTVVKDNRYRETPVELQVRGAFAQLMGFMKKLEDADRFNAITGMTVIANRGLLETKIALTVYTFGPGQPANNPAASKPASGANQPMNKGN